MFAADSEEFAIFSLQADNRFVHFRFYPWVRCQMGHIVKAYTIVAYFFYFTAEQIEVTTDCAEESPGLARLSKEGMKWNLGPVYVSFFIVSKKWANCIYEKYIHQVPLVIACVGAEH